MTTVRVFFARVLGSLRALRSDDSDRQLHEELEVHLEMETAENVRRGFAPDEARRRALIASGGVAFAEDAVRDRQRLPFFEQLIGDLRYAARSLRRAPAFTAVVVATLALGVGANTAIFSVVDGIILRPLPYREPERILSVVSSRKGEPMAVSAVDFVDWRRMSHSFSAMAAGYADRVVLTGTGEPERLLAQRVSPELFDLLGIPPIIGRILRSSDDEPGAPRVAMLDEGTWRRRFGGDPGIIGQAVTLNGSPVTIVGVASSRVRWPEEANLWLPTSFGKNELALSARGARWLSVIARLRDGTTSEAARLEMEAVAARLSREFPQYDQGVSVRVRPLLEDMVGDVRRPLVVLLAAVGSVLLIACANVSSLLLGRLAARDAELAVRVALGAGRARIARQVMTEALLLSLVGAIMGIALAASAVHFLITFAPPSIPRLHDVTIDARVLLFTLVVTLVTTLIFGIVPALTPRMRELHERLQGGGRSLRGTRASARTRRILVVFEVSSAIVLLAGAGLLLRSMTRLRAVDPGFHTEQVTTFALDLPESRYDMGEKRRIFVNTLVSELRRLPGVNDVAVSFALPMSGDSYRMSFDVSGRPAPNANEEPRAQVRSASPEYFRTMGIRLVRGRLFDERDRSDAPQVVVISEEVARRVFPDEDPIGRYLKTGWGEEGRKFGGEVIGIVGDVRQVSLDGQPASHMYMSYEQWPVSSIDLLVRGATPMATLLTGARAALRQLDPDVPLNAARPLSAIIDASVGDRLFYLTLLGAFAGVAVILAVIGLYGVIAYAVQQRRDELGIRIALGATRSRVVRLVLSDGMRLVVIGVAIGMAVAWGATTALTALLYGVGARDPVTFVVAPALLVAAALVACVVPAWKAARLDPLATLRAE